MKHSLWLSACMALAAALPGWSFGAGPISSPKSQPVIKTVEMFAGMEAGDIEVTMIMKDSTEGMVLVKNKTEQPLTIKIPAAFAGVPVLGQRGGMGGMGGMGGGGRNGGMGGMGGMQGMGGGMMGGMGGMGGGMGGGMMGGMMSVAPDKMQKVKIAAVCLDHGKHDPNPRVPYKPVPIESYAKDPAIAELVKMVCHGELDQHSAQAAAWHIQNGLSWEQLLNKVGIKHIDGRKEPYFTPVHMQRAMVATQVAQRRADAAKEQAPAKSVGEELVQQP